MAITKRQVLQYIKAWEDEARSEQQRLVEWLEGHGFRLWAGLYNGSPKAPYEQIINDCEILRGMVNAYGPEEIQDND